MNGHGPTTTNGIFSDPIDASSSDPVYGSSPGLTDDSSQISINDHVQGGPVPNGHLEPNGSTLREELERQREVMEKALLEQRLRTQAARTVFNLTRMQYGIVELRSRSQITLLEVKRAALQKEEMDIFALLGRDPAELIDEDEPELIENLSGLNIQNPTMVREFLAQFCRFRQRFGISDV